MSVLNTLYDKVQQVNEGLKGDLIRDVLMDHREDIIEQQQIQLLEGKASNGDDIRPYYTEDLKPSGYFNSRESATRYAAWKESLFYPHQVKRNTDAPNLYINGKFHSELGVQFDADAVGIVPRTSYATRIVNKYGIATFGLMKEKWDTIWRERGALSQLIDSMRHIIFA